jgi:hypothetical protein
MDGDKLESLFNLEMTALMPMDGDKLESLFNLEMTAWMPMDGDKLESLLQAREPLQSRGVEISGPFVITEFDPWFGNDIWLQFGGKLIRR